MGPPVIKRDTLIWGGRIKVISSIREIDVSQEMYTRTNWTQITCGIWHTLAMSSHGVLVWMVQFDDKGSVIVDINFPTREWKAYYMYLNGAWM